MRQQSTTTFRERTRPPWLLLLGLFVIVTAASEALEVHGDDWWRSVAHGGLLFTGFATCLLLVNVQVTDGAITWAKRGGGPQLPIEQLAAIRILTGPALRASRKRLTPSFRLHCPVWERTGVQLVTEVDGARYEYLLAVRDLAGLLHSIGRPDLVVHHDQVPVPI